VIAIVEEGTNREANRDPKTNPITLETTGHKVAAVPNKMMRKNPTTVSLKMEDRENHIVVIRVCQRSDKRNLDHI